VRRFRTSESESCWDCWDSVRRTRDSRNQRFNGGEYGNTYYLKSEIKSSLFFSEFNEEISQRCRFDLRHAHSSFTR